MLRSAVISLLALFLLTGGFLIYWNMQKQPSPPPDAGADSSIPTTAPTDPTQLKIGRGRTAWADSYTDGRLSSKFRADEYTPMQEAGKFKVVNPVWIFYLADGQYLLVKGDQGTVHVDTAGAADKSIMDSSVPQSPDNGALQNVWIALYPSQQAEKPTLWLETNNVAFDNETLRLYTQTYQDANGVTIPGDQAPVKVRGDDYEFDGKGLKLDWDDRDHHLQLLEIAHGRRLEIKNPSKVSAPMTSQPTSSLQSGQPVFATVLPTPTPATQPVQIFYRAVFNDDVQVFQGDRQVAKANTMIVDFLPANQKPAATPPSTTEPFQIEPAAPTAVDQAVGATPPPNATQPTTQPKTEPVQIYWTGKLHITPLPTPMMPLLPGQSVVRLEGSPVELTPAGSVIHAAAVVYRGADGAAQLENSTSVPRVDLKRDDGATFAADSLSYDPVTSLATVLGLGELHSPTEDKTGEMSARWNGPGFFHVVGKVNDSKSFVDHIDLHGDVAVDHPKLSLNSQELAIDMEKAPPAGNGERSGEQVKRITAIGNAVCRLKDETGSPKGIDGDRLVMETAPGPDGKPAPHTIVADGSVHAFDPTQQLRAGHLEAVLSPQAPPNEATQEDAEKENLNIESMYAKSAVHAVLKNGSTADSDTLRMTTVDGHHQIELHGASDPARLTNAQHSTLIGNVIHISPDEDQSAVVVDGAGAARVMRKASTTQPGQPMDLTWSDKLDGNGAANTIDVHGNVSGHTIGDQSDVQTVVCDWAHVDLMDAKPPEQPKAETATPAGGADTDQVSGKQIKKLTLNGNVEAQSLLVSPDGVLLLRRDLTSSLLNYDAVAGIMKVPAPGKILIEDHRKAAAANAAAGGGGATGNSRGKMAIAWAGSLVYDRQANQIVFDRNVQSAFLQDGKDASPMTLTCDRLTADLTTAPATTTTSEKTTLKHAHAEGAVNFNTLGAKAFRFTAHTVDYDPTTSRMTAHGSVEQPGTFEESDGSNGSFEELIYNVEAQQPEIIKRGQGEVRH
jgi:hypothetical protein